MIDVREITDLQAATVELWHREALANPYTGFLEVVCRQHAFNFQLWHEEDIARSPNVSAERIAEVKRAIDGFNQKRNDAIEQLDAWLLSDLAQQKIVPAAGAKRNTETPGSAIDRLSIMALRRYHMREQAERTDATPEHRAKAEARLKILHEQQADLSQSLAELLADIFAGRKQLKVYFQFKMYNDPTMNPYLYQPDAGAERANDKKS